MQDGPAIARSQITRLQELVYELEIAEIMTQEMVTVTPQTSMADLRKVLRDHSISGAPVVENGELVGVISIEDLIETLAMGEMNAVVGEKMTRDPVVLSTNDPVVLSVDYFARYGFGRFPVVDKKGKLAGIITQGDVTHGLLKRLEVEYHEGEIRRYRASHIFEDLVSDRTTISLHYDVVTRDFDRAGGASRKIKRALNHLGFSPQIIRRAAIATYESEMNIIIHADEPGGVIDVEVQPSKISIEAVDKGPGIPDIEQAMRPGFSTAPEWVREMGFGAGMGLKNIKKCADEMHLVSFPGNGTTLKVAIYLNQSRSRSKSRGAS